MHAVTPGAAESFPFVYEPGHNGDSDVGKAINGRYLADEAEVVRELVAAAGFDEDLQERIAETAHELVTAVRRNRAKSSGLDAFMKQYDLSSQEGVVLMCLAEALLRIPDADTADRLIADKISAGDWEGHAGTSDSLFVNASTWGLMLTGRMILPESDAFEHPQRYLKKLVSRMGEPVVRGAMRQAMRIMGHQFVMGRTIEDALKRARAGEYAAYRYSFDMLGEAALTDADAGRYAEAYAAGIDSIGRGRQADQTAWEADNISVKLSALFPRYEYAQRTRVLAELVPVFRTLALKARAAGIGLTMDAEEADRLELSLQVFEAVYRTPELEGWDGLGLAVQAYQKRALSVVSWLAGLARSVGRCIPVRLVKGAYWDTEIKRAQEAGLEGYPVFTRKANTDVSYLACARALLAAGDALYPRFATHNAHTVASVIHMAGEQRRFEFQRLHGMGEELYAEVVGPEKLNLPCRVYAPVGEHEDLLPYLVRRLLENGANTSFVNRIVDEKAPVEEIIADPVRTVSGYSRISHPRIPLPEQMYGEERANSRGLNLADSHELMPLGEAMARVPEGSWSAKPVVGGRILGGSERVLSVNPADTRRSVGEVVMATEGDAQTALDMAALSQPRWDATPAARRSEILLKAADLFEAHAAELMGLCVLEAGKSVPDCVAELREAVDFLRYYAAGARRDFGGSVRLPGPTGESNELSLHGRGIFVCISPWNCPLAIFTGQVAAALAAGNSVIAKPAEQTSIVAARATALLYEAGIPSDVLHFLPGDGARLGGWLLSDPRVAGVAFTGSTETARIINRQLASRDGPIAALIAETGGQNALLVDSSALPEQVVLDIVRSSFNSAGQRCSALRVAFLQEEIADRTLELLKGYMDQLVVGNPAFLCTDVGPVIDSEALITLEKHTKAIARFGRVIHRCELSPECEHGTFFSPAAVEIDSLDRLEREVFGPVLHVVRYRARDLEDVIRQINATGFGLTLGVHTRIDGRAREIFRKTQVGNTYVNRNMVGAVVGVQPFGGRGLSGTGPKAGGPHYLHRFATEKALSINTAAVGGNASLLALDEG